MAARLRVIGTLIAVALTLTGAQCITACAVASCHAEKDVAPCHQGRHGHAPKVPVACSHDLGAGRTAHLNGQFSGCDFSSATVTMTAIVPAPIVAAGYRVPRQSPSPPGLITLSAVVLRI
jgi:hypothetical protein